MRKALVLVLLASSLICGPALAQKMSVYMTNTTPDDVGGRMAYAVREGFRRSAGFRLVDREADSGIAVRLVTLNPDQARGLSIQTVYAVVWTTHTYTLTPVTMYLTHSVGTCGSSRIQECADGLVADTDQQAQQLRAALEEVLNGLKKK